MKKYLLLFSTLFVLAACNSGSNDSKDSTTKSTAAATEKTSSKATTATSENSSSKNSSTTSNTKTQTSSTKTDSSHGNHAMSAMDELQANYPNDKFPDPATISGGKQIGITASEEQGTLKVNYYVVNEETPFNDPALNDKHQLLNSNARRLIQRKQLKTKLGKPMIQMVSRLI